jgi:tRNA(Ile)-lysidine synthase
MSNVETPDMKDLRMEFAEYVQRENLFHPGDKLLLAISGGLDSCVLAKLCHDAGYDMDWMHVNFGLRGAESDRDEAFVRHLAASWNIQLHCTQFPTKDYAKAHKLSTQEAARELRYQWFADLRTSYKDRRTWILTAHHADDNIETALMNWVKGTGIRGMRGMLPVSDGIVRPLLFASRERLEAFAKQEGLTWVEDSSNQSNDYTRNFLRNEVMPQIRKLHPGAQSNMISNMERFREVEVLYQQALETHRKKLLKKQGEEWRIPVNLLRITQPLRTVYFELLREFGFRASQMDDLLHLLDSESGKYVASPSHRLIRHQRWLIIAPLETEQAAILPIEGMGNWQLGSSEFSIRALDHAPEDFDLGADKVLIPQNLLQFPLLLRPRKTGDYFYPLGMRKKKKLSRFLLDSKVPAHKREGILVLEMQGKIVWIPGLRLDDRFKVNNQKEPVYLLEFNNKALVG